MAFMYILECADKTLYTGSAKDLEERIEKHNKKLGAKYTRGRTPVKLLYFEEFEKIGDAYKREIIIKRLSRKNKLKLIELSEKGESNKYISIQKL